MEIRHFRPIVSLRALAFTDTRTVKLLVTQSVCKERLTKKRAPIFARRTDTSRLRRSISAFRNSFMRASITKLRINYSRQKWFKAIFDDIETLEDTCVNANMFVLTIPDTLSVDQTRIIDSSRCIINSGIMKKGRKMKLAEEIVHLSRVIVAFWILSA